MQDLVAYRLEQETRGSLAKTNGELMVFFDEIIFPQDYLSYPKFEFKRNSGLSTELKLFIRRLVEVHYEEKRAHLFCVGNIPL